MIHQFCDLLSAIPGLKCREAEQFEARLLQQSPVTSRTASRRARTTEQLLRAAYRLMSRDGVEATTIQQITDGADVGFGTFYNYFASKDDIAARVLDCTIHNMGRRNDAANRAAGVSDPVLIICNSVRLVGREMLTNKMWRWWLARPDLVVERMRAGFAPFGLRDMQDAVTSGSYVLIDGDYGAAWSNLIWLIVGGVKDILDGQKENTTADRMTEAAMRVMGVPLERSRELTSVPLPDYPDLPIDFTFELETKELQLARSA